MFASPRSVTRALLLAWVATPGAAYELKTDGTGSPLHWPEMPVSYAVAADGSRDLPIAAAERSVRAAFDAWDEVHGAKVEFRYDGVVDGLEAGYDRADGAVNHNAVVWSRDLWDFEPDALAITLTLYRRGTGELVDADILINERSYEWGVGEEVENDLQNAITHEIGHFLGLGHSDVREATMYPSAAAFEMKKRSLHDDDENAVLTLYPSLLGRDLSARGDGAAHRDDAVEAPEEPPEAPLPPEKVSFGCDVGPRSPAGWLPLALLLVGVRRRVR